MSRDRPVWRPEMAGGGMISKGCSLQGRIIRNGLLATLATLGFLGLSACSSEADAKPKPTQTAQVAEESAPKPSKTTSAEPDVFVTKVDKIRDWSISAELKANLIQLGILSQGAGQGDFDIVRTETCNQLHESNPFLAEFGPASPSDSAEAVELRYQAKQQIFRDYVSDVFRVGGGESFDSSDALSGMVTCLSGGLRAKGISSNDWMAEILDDEPLPTVTTRIDHAAGHEYDDRGFRWTTVTVAIEGRDIGEPVHRRHQWNHLTKDWDLINEQTNNPGNGGWNE